MINVKINAKLKFMVKGTALKTLCLQLWM